MPKSFQQSVSAKSSIRLLLLLLVLLCPGMVLLGGIHFRLSWLRGGCFGLESNALCASQGFSLVKLNSFLFSSNPFNPPPPTAPLLFCGLMLLSSWATLPILLFQAFSYLDKFDPFKAHIFSYFEERTRASTMSANPHSF